MLTPEEKIEYLWDAQSMGSTAAILKQIDKLDIFDRREPEDPIMSTQEIISGDFRLTVTTFDEFIHLNSNSLKVIRQFVTKMWHDGYIRVFRILAKHDCICEN